MFDFYVVVDGELLKLWMHPSGEIEGPSARIRLGCAPKRMEWLEEAQMLAIFAPDSTFLVSADFASVRELPPLAFVSPDGGFGFALDGNREAKDLVVAPLAGGAPFAITGLGVYPGTHCFVRELDALVLLGADTDAVTGRNIFFIPMEQLRQWTKDGITRATSADLDYDTILGLRTQLPQDLPIYLVELAQHPGFVAYWNTKPQAGGITSTNLTVFEYPYWTKSSSARSQVRMQSKVHSLDRFWTCELIARRMRKGGMALLAVGTARKGSDFILGVQALRVPEATPDVRGALGQKPFTEIRSNQVVTRHAGGITDVQAMPGGTGLLLVAEDPQRTKRMFRVDVGPSQLAELLVDFDVLPQAFRLAAEDVVERTALGDGGVRPALAPAFGGATTSKVKLKLDPTPEPAPSTPGRSQPAPGAQAAAAPQARSAPPPAAQNDTIDADFVDVELEPAPAPAAPPKATPAAAPTAPAAPEPKGTPTAPAREVVWSGTLPVMAGVGIDLPLGVLPADCPISASVVAVGEAKQANLRFWLSQQAAAGDTLYQLHLRADAFVNVRCTVTK
jgi:hypothetical protein